MNEAPTTSLTTTPTPTTTIGSLFTGGGGLDMAVDLLIPNAEHLWFSELDRFAAEVFTQHHPGIPNLGDISQVDFAEVAPVDVLVGGFPCQDISHAGNQAGIQKGTRSGLWYRFAAAIDALRPRLVIVENVAAITARGLDIVAASLAEVGFDAEWGVLAASDVGACHRRNRWFAVAWPADADADPAGWREQGGEEPVRAELVAPEHAGDAAARGLAVAHAGVVGREDGQVPQAWQPQPVDGGEVGARGVGSFLRSLTLLPTPAVNDMGAGKTVDQWDTWTEAMRHRHGNGNGHGKSLSIEVQRLLPTPVVSLGRNATSGRKPDAVFHTGTTLLDVAYGQRWAEYAPAIARHEQVFGCPAPDPIGEGGHLSPEFVEWMMGWPVGYTDGVSRSQRLKILGNGVVPQQAAAAAAQLLDRAAA